MIQRIQRRLIGLPAAFVLATGLTLSGLSFYFAYLKVSTDAQAEKTLRSKQVATAITERINAYSQALYSLRAFILSRPGFNRDDFNRYVNNLSLLEIYPGVQALAYTPYSRKENFSALVTDLQKRGLQGFKIWPPNDVPDAVPIGFIEPWNDRNRRAVGFDMFHEPIRREALERARDTALPTMTGPVYLVQETTAQKQLGFLVVLPIYEEQMPMASLEQRRSAITGFVAAVFRSGDFFSRILDEQRRSVDIDGTAIFDGTEAKADKLIYNSTEGSTASPAGSVSEYIPAKVYGRDWLIRVTTTEQEPGWIPWAVLFFGATISFIAYGFAKTATRFGSESLASENRWELVTSALPVLISYIDAKGIVKSYNAAVAGQFGAENEDLRGQSLAQVFGTDFWLASQPNFRSALEGGASAFETELKLHNGTLRTFKFEFIPDRSPKGGIKGVVFLGIDVTEQRRNEVRLLEEQKVSEAIIEIGLSVASQLDLEKLVQSVTDTATRMTNAQFGAFFYNVVNAKGEAYTLYTVSGAPLEAFSKFPHPRKTKIFAPTFDGEGIRRYDDVTKRPEYGQSAPHFGMPEGHLPVRSYLAAPVKSKDGKVIGGLFFGHAEAGVFTQRAEKLVSGIAAQAAVAIDNAKLYRESQTVNRIKDEFLATLSHELRTPLNVIMGHADILRLESGGDEQMKQSVEAIYRNARTQNQIISDLLDISAIVSGKIHLSPVRTKMGDVVGEAIEHVRFAAEAKGVQLEFENRDPNCAINADPTRLQQVIWNLLTNAIKFTPRQGVVRVISFSSKSLCRVEVSDTGIGIERDFLPYVFERFRQEDSTTTRRFGGLGLGLSIVKNLVELHGGSVEVRSDGKNKGTTFLVSLPIAPLPVSGKNLPEPPSPPTDSDGVVGPTIANRLVLLVDDEPDALGMLKQLLEMRGARVLTATSAAEGLRLWSERSPSLIISDIGMPDEDGLAFMRRLRSMEAETTGFTPSIALTAYAREQDRNKVLSAGFQAFLTKPVEPVVLIKTIERVLESVSV